MHLIHGLNIFFWLFRIIIFEPINRNFHYSIGSHRFLIEFSSAEFTVSNLIISNQNRYH